MRKDWIRKRQRKAQQISGIMKLANQTGINELINESESNTSTFTTEPNISIQLTTSTNDVQVTSNQNHCLNEPFNTNETNEMYRTADYAQYNYSTDYNGLNGQAISFHSQPIMEPIITNGYDHLYVPLNHNFQSQTTCSSIHQSVSYLSPNIGESSSIDQSYIHHTNSI